MRSFIGIDLGTTNCAMAWVFDAAAEPAQTQVVTFCQTMPNGSRVDLPGLPSFLYWAGSGASASPWQPGVGARERLPEQPDRVVHSAKSWLMHHGADRNAPFLPLGSQQVPPSQKLSPVDAQTLLLRECVMAWSRQFPDLPIGEQTVAVTVPASFDPVAQQLTRAAALAAGLPESTILLEEPQAAFFAWLENSYPEVATNHSGAKSDSPLTRATLSELFAASGATGADALRHVLVVDIGGGTTDFTLFAVQRPTSATGLPKLERIAVSPHLLLGGDNMDLALAHAVEGLLPDDTELASVPFDRLIAQCRDIKEAALADNSIPGRNWQIAVAQQGRSLLSKTLTASVTEGDVSHLLLDGFFPIVGTGERPESAPAGLREMGLPYARDPAITRHMAAFLAGQPPVDAVLFNGGVSQSPAIRTRILDNLRNWFNRADIFALTHPQPDLAVARGAAHLLRLRHGKTAYRVEGGSPRAYYIGIDEANAVCLIPHGAANDSWFAIQPARLRVRVGQAVGFPLFAANNRPHDAPGDLVDLSQADAFLPLPALETFLAPQAQLPSRAQPRARLRACLRSTGLLEVTITAIPDDHPAAATKPNHTDPHADNFPTWPLQFALRGNRTIPLNASTPADNTSLADANANVAADETARLLDKIFSVKRNHSQSLSANALFGQLERKLATSRHDWPAQWLRQQYDLLLLEFAEQRHLSAAHEALWWQLAGWWLRPGCGWHGDPIRIQQLNPLILAGPSHNSGAVTVQFLIALRRIAPGLSSDTAQHLWHQHIAPALAENAAAHQSRTGGLSAEQALLAGSLELLPAQQRIQFAQFLTHAIAATPQQGAYWRALGSCLSRLLFYAGAEAVLPPDHVSAAWQTLRKVTPPDSLRTEAATMWLRMARLTGLRPIDVDRSCRNQIDSLLKRWNLPPVRRRILHEIVPLSRHDHHALLGDSTPAGLLLR